MARGWESKSVESQIEAAESRRKPSAAQPLSPEQMEREQRRASLELNCRRVLHDLEAAQNPRYREMLQSSLRHLQEKIAALNLFEASL